MLSTEDIALDELEEELFGDKEEGLTGIDRRDMKKIVKEHYSRKDNETNYIFFSEKLKNEQLAKKERKFKRELENNKIILKKTKAGKEIDEFLTEEGTVTTRGILQKTLDEIKNPTSGIHSLYELCFFLETRFIKPYFFC